MRKLILVLSVLFPALAFAQGGLNPIAVNGNHVNLSAPDATPSSLNLQVPNAGGSFNVYVGGSQRLSIDGSGNEVSPAYVVTPALTAVAGTNVILGSVAVFPTAAANAAALLPSSPTAGMVKLIVNNGPNAVKVRVGVTETMNALGTPGASLGAPLATMQQMRCVATSATNWNCNQMAVATPAA